MTIRRPLSLRWNQLVAKDTSRNIIFTLRKRGFFSYTYDLREKDGSTVCIRRIQSGHWICEYPDYAVAVYRLSGSKCVISKNGSQVAIMSIQPGLQLFNGHKIHLRVNEAQYLHLSIAVALLLDDFSLHVDTTMFRQPEVSTLQTR
ncbi:MAG: hypothetical protein RIG62_07465 [Cyclobacteriaceae bacterium]